LAKHCRFEVCGEDGAEANRALATTRFELLSRIVRNLSSNFFRDGIQSPQGLLAIQLIHRPFLGIRLEQHQPTVLSTEWIRDAGYRPIAGADASERNHHGLFLCGAIARFLGGYAWAGNREGRNARSIVSIVVPLLGPS
jgi:hypothetical protein